MADEKEKYVRKEYNEANDTATKSAWDRANTLSTAKPTYTSQWGDTLNTLANDILNRKKFSYDLNGDALYQQYKDKYINQGRLAMADTIGQASAMTGGYGNSYAVTAGNQAYQSSLQNLNDIVPELYQLALDKYNADGQELYNQYGLISDRENTEYGKYRDSVTDWDNDYNRAITDYWNNKNFGYTKHTDDENFRYTEHRNSIADEQWKESLNASKGSSGGGGGGGDDYSLTAKEWNDISARCDEYIVNGDGTGLKNYLQGLYNRGYITKDEYADFYEQFMPKVEDPPKGNGVVGGGGGGSRYTTALLN